MVKALDQKLVFAPNSAQAFHLDDFEKPPVVYGRRFNPNEFCNIQDPIDLCHNVTQSIWHCAVERLQVKAKEMLAAFAQSPAEQGVCSLLFNALLKNWVDSRPQSSMDVDQH